MAARIGNILYWLGTIIAVLAIGGGIKRRSLRQIATKLAADGYLNSRDKSFDAKQISRMVA